MITYALPIIPPCPRLIIEREVARLRPLVNSTRGSLSLYTFHTSEAPALMREVARLREEAFRRTGACSGRALDMDDCDVSLGGYRQLVAWDRARCRVVGGYRYIVGHECDMDMISTLNYFHFSPTFVRRYLPRAIELGRSFSVHEDGTSSLFTMCALWRGLGRIVRRERADYLFGKVTIPPRYDGEALRLLLLFLRKNFPAREALLTARQPLVMEEGNDPFIHDDFSENFALLEHLLRSRGERIPPMIHAYMRLSRKMQVFDATRNPDLGDATEVAILLTVKDIFPDKQERYIK